MRLRDSWYKQLINAWKTKKQAQWILQSQFEKSWIFKPWTQELTTYGRYRQNMSEEERAIDRYSRWHKISPYKLKYVNGKVLVKNIFKRRKRK